MIAAALREQGVDVPDDCTPADVWPVAQPYMDAFHTLSRSRGHGMNGPLPFAYSEIVAYARDHDLADTESDLDEFVTIMQEMDTMYRTHVLAKAPA